MALSPKEIGRRIREVAEEVGVGRAEIADALGVDQNTISKLEMGTLDPIPGDYVLVIARLLKTDFGISSPVILMTWKPKRRSYFGNWPRQRQVTSSPSVALFHSVCRRKTSRLSFRSKDNRTFLLTEPEKPHHGCTKIKVEMRRNKKESVWALESSYSEHL